MGRRKAVVNVTTRLIIEKYLKRVSQAVNDAEELEYLAFEIATSNVPTAIRREATKCHKNLERGLVAAERLALQLQSANLINDTTNGGDDER